MRFKKIFLLICLVICLFTIASACAGDVNDMAIASEDTGQGDLFQSEKMADDNLQTVEKQANDDEIVGAQNNPDDYYIAGQLNKGSYTDLQFMIDNCTEDTLYLDYNITFDPDYDLAPDNPYNESINFTEGIQIKKTLTIEGNGYAINGLNMARIFDVVGNNIVINNITFVNGKSKIGGAILFNDDVSNIVIDNCKFMSNSATNNGGAVYVNGKFNKSAIQNTVFISNSATKNGGAVYIFNSSLECRFENLTFSNNKAENADGGAINFHWELLDTSFKNITFFKNSAGNGGGAINMDQDANYDNSYVDVKFINNTASYKGGAMHGYGQSNRNSFDGCLFENNSALRDGGAIYYKKNINSNVFEDCSFIKNTANYGGAISTDGAFNNNRLNNDSFVNNRVILNQISTANGGALYVQGKFTKNIIENSEFINNVAANNGGAVYIYDNSNDNKFENVTFSYNKAEKNDGGAINFHGETSKIRFNNVTFFKNSAKKGGGAINTDKTVNDDNSYVDVKFINNTASNGGAMHGYGQSNRNSFDGCLFANNSVTGYGGAIYYQGNINSNVFEDSSFIKNTAIYGGAIYANAAFNNNRFNKDSFVNNSATTANGGALYVQDKFTKNVIENSEFINNVATSNGGAVYTNGISNGNKFENVTFSNNKAKNKDGGAVNFHGELLEASFKNITFFKNSAGNGGGAINTDHSVNNDNTYVDVKFINNTASNGGALNGYGLSKGNTFDGCLFANNSATGDGGAIYYKGNITSNTFENDCFINNFAGNNGGAMFCFRYSISNKFNKDLFINNSASNGGAISFVNTTNTVWNNTIFSQNKANARGGAINFQNMAGPVTISAIFINNIGDSVININKSNQDSIIRDSIFINSNSVNVQVSSGSIQLINNWFGNNATNYNETPNVGSVDVDNWLFLNATANPDIVEVLNSSEIVFKLYIYDKNTKKTDEYDNTLLIPVNLTISSTGGFVDKSTVNFGDSISYTATDIGVNGVTATIENIKYTIELNNKMDANLSAEGQVIVYGQNATITLNYNSSATGKVNITLAGKKGTLEYTNLDLNAKIVLPSDISVDEYDVTVVYSGDATFFNATAKATLTVNKATAEINVVNKTIDLEVRDEIGAGVSLSPANAGNLTYNSNNPSVAVVEDGKIKAIGQGQATITVSFTGNENYYPAENKTITVNVSFKDASVSVDNSTLYLKVDDIFPIVAKTNPVGLNVTYVVDKSGVVSVDANGVVTALNEGNATILVKVGGDGVYVENSTSIVVIVSKISSEIIVQNITVNMKVNEIFDPVVSLMPSNAGNLSFRSSDASVVLVNGHGFIAAVGEGNATITVAFGGNRKYAASQKIITVNVTLNDASVSVNNSTLDLKVNDIFDLVATTLPKDLPVNFTSNNVSVVTVDAEGKVVAVGEGSAVITVSVGGDGAFALNSTTVNVNVNKRELNISATVFSLGGNITLFVSGFENATGNFTVTVGENIYNSSIMWGGMAFVSIPPIDKNVKAYIYYPGDETYCNASTTVDLTVKKNLNITVSVNPIHVGENAIVIVTGLENATGNVSVIAGRGFYNAPIINGTAKAIIPGLNSTTTAYVLFLGDDNYNMNFTSVNITVLADKESVTITASPVTATYNINKNLVITLNDANGKALSGVKVIVDLNGAKTYVTDKNGQIKVNVAKLVPNKYTAVITFDGDDVYAKSTKNVQVTVKKAKAKIKAKNKTFKSNKKVKKYKIALKDKKGKAIKKVKVTLKIKGKKLIKAKTNSKGKATFKIKNLKKAGKHKAKIKFKGNKYYKKATKKVKIRVK